MSDSVPPHRRQPTRLPRPWDSPGKNTGVGCHFLLQCMKVKSQSEVAQLCPTLSDPMDCSPPGSSVHGIFQARVLEWDAIAFSVCNNSFNSHNSPKNSIAVIPFYRSETVCEEIKPSAQAHYGGSDGKESAYNVRDLSSIPGSGSSPGEGNGNPFQYSCLENSMDRGAW